MSTAPEPTPSATVHTVVLEPQHWTFTAAGDDTLFQSARNAGIRLPTLCRTGTCRSCYSKMLSGGVRYLVDWPGLSAQEKEEGYILPCVAVPTSSIVMVNPHAERIEGR